MLYALHGSQDEFRRRGRGEKSRGSVYSLTSRYFVDGYPCAGRRQFLCRVTVSLLLQLALIVGIAQSTAHAQRCSS
jgi:hypothetical protein